MPLFPIFTDIKNQHVLIVGGGAVALRKAEKLLAFGPEIQLVAPKVCPELEVLADQPAKPTNTDGKLGPELEKRCAAAEDLAELSSTGAEERLVKLRLCRRNYEDSDLEGAVLVVAASDNPDLNHGIAEKCLQRHIPCNVTDDKAYCTFQFPSLINRGELTVAVSTGGASPAAAAFLREKIEEFLPEDLDIILEDLERKRTFFRSRFKTQPERSRLARALFQEYMLLGRPFSDDEFRAWFEAAAGCCGRLNSRK